MSSHGCCAVQGGGTAGVARTAACPGGVSSGGGGGEAGGELGPGCRRQSSSGSPSIPAPLQFKRSPLLCTPKMTAAARREQSRQSWPSAPGQTGTSRAMLRLRRQRGCQHARRPQVGQNTIDHAPCPFSGSLSAGAHGVIQVASSEGLRPPPSEPSSSAMLQAPPLLCGFHCVQNTTD